uniref:Cystatin domain-containing protein n=1 Tax=Sus scrofa TaxID=9823 RepID=A0A8D0SWT3_PIG
PQPQQVPSLQVMTVGTDTALKRQKKKKSTVYVTILPITAPFIATGLWFAMREYNKESEDKYIFRVVKVVRVQLQVTDLLEYFIDAEIARTNCRKLPNSDENCVVKETSKLEKRQMCNFLVGTLPWKGKFVMMKQRCVEA